MRILKFNMIEIVLAIGIAAFGIMGVVAMIPPALNANRDVSADAFVDEAASKMRFYVKGIYVPNWNSRINNINYCPTSGTVANLNEKTKSDNVFEDTTKYPNEMRAWNIFKTSADNVFYLTSSDSTIAAHAVIWKQPIQQIPMLPDGSNVPSYDDAAQIFIEISWPVNMAQANRQKRTITFEVYKQ